MSKTSSIATESYYVKKSDGFVYYCWRIQGHDTWNIHKTAMLDVPTIEMVREVQSKALAKLASTKTLPLDKEEK